MEAKIFQSTPSAWRVTDSFLQVGFPNLISIHTLRMEGDHWWKHCWTVTDISIHTLRVEGDHE